MTILTTTKEQVSRWSDIGMRARAKGMLVLQNKATGEEYPVYVRNFQSINDQVNCYNRSYTDKVVLVVKLY